MHTIVPVRVERLSLSLNTVKGDNFSSWKQLCKWGLMADCSKNIVKGWDQMQYWWHIRSCRVHNQLIQIAWKQCYFHIKGRLVTYTDFVSWWKLKWLRATGSITIRVIAVSRIFRIVFRYYIILDSIELPGFSLMSIAAITSVTS